MKSRKSHWIEVRIWRDVTTDQSQLSWEGWKSREVHEGFDRLPLN